MLHGSGIRDCYKVFGVSHQTTLNLILSEGEKIKITPQRKHYQQVQIDEMYSFVGKKNKKVWLFYAYAPETKEILAITMGKRSRKQLQSLMIQLKNLHIEIDFYCTDKFEAFKEILPYYSHLIGKRFTKNIEGINTLIRSKIARLQRRTTKFSKKLIVQWFLMKLFIFYFNQMPSYI
ncbi:IS1 family transposase [Emticicia sp. SJ17W-69]|uniref:IS1 family transposase n=1 Tax=Emticicia sp. SJ17W-69 TaxID=3421657 RepID=UPI003EB7C020